MIDLTTLTKPGPFGPRTHELGNLRRNPRWNKAHSNGGRTTQSRRLHGSQRRLYTPGLSRARLRRHTNDRGCSWHPTTRRNSVPARRGETIREPSRYTNDWVSESVTVVILQSYEKLPAGSERAETRDSKSLFVNANSCKPRLYERKWKNLQRISVEVEIDFDGDLHAHGMAVAHGGFELPVLDGFDSLFIESHSQAAQDVDIARTAVGSDD